MLPFKQTNYIMVSLKDLRKLIKPSEITYLDLSNCSDYSGVEDYPNIKELKICNLRLSSSPALEPLKKLEKLNLSHNQINNIGPFPRLLRTCDLSFNALSQVSMGKLNYLTELNISNNRVSSLEGLSSLLSLSYLYCSNNLITSLQALNSIPILELDISSNLIPTFTTLAPVLDTIQVIKVANNPCVKSSCSIFHSFTQHTDQLYSRNPLNIPESKLLKNFIGTKSIKLSKSTIIQKLSAELSVLKGKNSNLAKKVKKIEKSTGTYQPDRLQEVENMSYEDWRSGIARFQFLSNLYSTSKLPRIKSTGMRLAAKQSRISRNLHQIFSAL